MLVFLMMILSYLSWTFHGVDGKEYRCVTPDGLPGVCMEFKQCQPIAQYLSKHKKPRTPQEITRFKKQLCPFRSSSNKKLICCAEKFLDNNPKVPETSIENPADVSKHNNLHLLPFECGKVTNEDKIKNGKTAMIGEFPWMAILFFEEVLSRSDHPLRSDLKRCAGTIINERYILTAAHCLEDKQFRLMYVRAGEHDLSKKNDCSKKHKKCAPRVQDVQFEDIIIHPNYTGYRNDDIALVRVGNINFGETVGPICLPIDPELSKKHYDNLEVTGWGDISQNAAPNPILQKVELPFVDLKTCRKVYEKTTTITERHICAGGSIKASCKGDSGGPLQTKELINGDIRTYQVGVISFGPSFCGRSGSPIVTTRVAFYMDWILDSMRPWNRTRPSRPCNEAPLKN